MDKWKFTNLGFSVHASLVNKLYFDSLKML